tara:strand:- start:5285 stop:5581 length:297 start_codon:yes stop_codon:yes gene_type:complete
VIEPQGVTGRNLAICHSCLHIKCGENPDSINNELDETGFSIYEMTDKYGSERVLDRAAYMPGERDCDWCGAQAPDFTPYQKELLRVREQREEVRKLQE